MFYHTDYYCKCVWFWMLSTFVRMGSLSGAPPSPPPPPHPHSPHTPYTYTHKRTNEEGLWITRFKKKKKEEEEKREEIKKKKKSEVIGLHATEVQIKKERKKKKSNPPPPLPPFVKQRALSLGNVEHICKCTRDRGRPGEEMDCCLCPSLYVLSHWLFL